jgi:hypothetical protein
MTLRILGVGRGNVASRQLLMYLWANNEWERLFPVVKVASFLETWTACLPETGKLSELLNVYSWGPLLMPLHFPWANVELCHFPKRCSKSVIMRIFCQKTHRLFFKGLKLGEGQMERKQFSCSSGEREPLERIKLWCPIWKITKGIFHTLTPSWCLLFFSPWDSFSLCSPGCLKLTILLPQPPEC